MILTLTRPVPVGEPRGPVLPGECAAPGNRNFPASHAGDVLSGFISCLGRQDMTHIMLITVEEALRRRGIGAKALLLLWAQKPGARIMAAGEAGNPPPQPCPAAAAVSVVVCGVHRVHRTDAVRVPLCAALFRKVRHARSAL